MSLFSKETKKKVLKRLKISPKVASYIMYIVYKLLGFTLRIEEINRQLVDNHDKKGQLMIFSLWHDELCPLMLVKRNLDIFTIVSPSKDGEYLSGLLERLNLHTVRGSSSRDGLKALLQSAKRMKEDKLHACITVDGPRGPRHVVKEGAVFLASLTGSLVSPVKINMKSSIKVNIWDKFQIPLPFSKVLIEFAEPYSVPAFQKGEKNTFMDERGLKLASFLNK